MSSFAFSSVAYRLFPITMHVMLLKFMAFCALATFVCLVRGPFEAAVLFFALFVAAPFVYIGWYLLYGMQNPVD
jgi:hypothetical protein